MMLSCSFIWLITFVISFVVPVIVFLMCETFVFIIPISYNCSSILTVFWFGPVRYVGHPISSDNGPISQKLLLKSESYYPLHVVMDVAY